MGISPEATRDNIGQVCLSQGPIHTFDIGKAGMGGISKGGSVSPAFGST
jgi:hypothetical protein